MPTKPEAGGERDVWVFGYGSLMWNPGFPFREARHARLSGFHRAFCIYSVHYRGTLKRPGLVLGLDRGGSCEGLAFRLEPSSAAEALAYLRARELIYGVYREALVPVRLLTGEAVPAPQDVLATTFIAERAHPAYTGPLSLRRQVELIRGAKGTGGTNLDYVLNTLAHLATLGIREPKLARIKALVGAFAERDVATNGRRPRCLSLTRAFADQPIERPAVVQDNRFGHRAKLAAGKP